MGRLTDSINQQNRRRAKKNNRIRLLGVCKSGKKWRAQIRLPDNGDNVYLGTFETAEKAHNAYVMAKRKLHPYSTI